MVKKIQECEVCGPRNGICSGSDGDTDYEKGEARFIDEQLLQARSVLISGPIGPELARAVCARLLALAHRSGDPVNLYISSPGGHVESGDMIHDTIRFIAPEVRILGMGWVASAGALIYVAVPTARRFCTPNTRFLLHQPSGGAGGQASDIEIQAREMLRMRDRLNRIFAGATGRKLQQIEADTDRDHWLTAEEAKAYGLVGQIVTNAREFGRTAEQGKKPVTRKASRSGQ